jgi:signal transduction histidine kinase
MVERPRLLLLESDAEVLLLVPPFMGRVGDVVVAQDLAGALEAVRAAPVHILLIGDELVASAGIEVLREVRTQQPHAQVLLLKNDSNIDVPAAFLAEGVGDTLVKPFDLAVLPSRVRKLLEVKDELERRDRAQREVEIRMQHASRMELLGSLVASVAHEVADPLSVVLSNSALVVEMLDERKPLTALERSFLDAATRDTLEAARSMKEYLSRILVLARRDRRARWDEDLSDTLGTALLFVRRRAQDKAVRIHANVSGVRTVPHVGPALAQAVANALSNAIDAAPANGNVRLHVEDHPDHLVIVVEDDGPGLQPEQARRLGDPFFTTKHDGAGLGAAVMLQVLREHGGSVEWNNRREGGVLVRLTLPRPLAGVARVCGST